MIYNQINLYQAASDTANIPLCTGPGAIHSGYNSVYSAAIGSLLCPSSPGPATINYFNAFWGPYGDGGGDVCTPGRCRLRPAVSRTSIRPRPRSGDGPITSRSRACTTRPSRPRE